MSTQPIDDFTPATVARMILAGSESKSLSTFRSLGVRLGTLLAPVAVAVVTIAILGWGVREAWAEHRIEVGDVLEFSVASLPNLKQRVAVDINGEINFPLLQDISAAGLPLAELQTKVRELISAKPFRQRSSDGQETLLTIDPDEITISMIEYRPIYITGDVAKAGEQPFRPGITVRQAIALGGGVDRSKAGGAALGMAADLKSAYKSLFADYIANRSAVDRLEAELAGQTTMSQQPISSAPIDPSVQHAIIDREVGRLSVSTSDYAKEKEFITRSIDEADKFIDALNNQQKNEKEGADLDSQDFDRTKDLFGKGAVPITRLMDSRRAMLLSATRQLQTSVAIADGVVRKDALAHSLDKLEDKRRDETLRDLQEAQLKLIDQQSKIIAVAQKMSLVGQSSDLSKGNVPEVRIFRKGQGEITPGFDDELQPGDVLTATLNSDLTTAFISH